MSGDGNLEQKHTGQYASAKSTYQHVPAGTCRHSSVGRARSW